MGLDVSKAYLDLACRPEPTRGRVANDRAGIAQALAPLRQLQPALIVLDATGGWQYALGAALALAQRPVAVGNPRQVRDVAQATGPWAKPAALDAGILAHVAKAVRPTPRPRPDDTTQPLDALLQRRRPRLERLVAERHRVARAHPTVRASRACHLDDRQRLITQTDEEVATLIRPSPAGREQDAL